MIERARLIRALLLMGIPYAEAMQMPLNLAYALLSDGRQKNTHPDQPLINTPPHPQSDKLTSGTTKIATRRKFPKKVSK